MLAGFIIAFTIINNANTHNAIIIAVHGFVFVKKPKKTKPPIYII
jgi:hypothetical protein